jgi:hypothetical protein
MAVRAAAAARRSRVGPVLLRIALAGGVFVVLALVISENHALFGLSSEPFGVANELFRLAILVGMVAPVFAIVGSIIMLVTRSRFSVLDWVSLALGLIPGLLPLLFMLAYSNCPNGIC